MLSRRQLQALVGRRAHDLRPRKEGLFALPEGALSGEDNLADRDSLRPIHQPREYTHPWPPADREGLDRFFAALNLHTLHF